MGDEHYIYLSNLGDRDLYPLNEPDSFVNKIDPPINLNVNREYEVGMINCFYPKKYFGVIKRDPSCSIEVIVESRDRSTSSFLDVIYAPRNIEAGNVRYIVDEINDLLLEKLRHLTGEEFYYGRDVLGWNSIVNRPTYTNKKGPCAFDEDLCSIGLRFGSRLARILGFSPKKTYVIYQNDLPGEEGVTYTFLTPRLPREDGGVDYALFYSDCVTPTRYSSQLVNLLGILTLEGAGDKSVPTTVYKTLNKSYIDSIAIKIADQGGAPIKFGKNRSVTVLLHIRPK